MATTPLRAMIEVSWKSAAFFVGGTFCSWFMWRLVDEVGPKWRKPNRRGRSIPVSLGWAFAFSVVTLVGVVIFQIETDGVRNSQMGELIGAAIVFLAGVLDDRFGGAVRGLRGHLRALLSGHLTTGGLKLAAAVLAAAFTVAWTPREHLWANLLAVVAIAGCTNIWNGLDVAPGRALKGFLVVAVVLLIVDLKAFLLVCTGAATAAIVPDLRERGMLGDSGANLLGFLAGAEIVGRLPEVWLIPAALIVIGLNVLAETVTFSRTIETIPPLRWFDRLGRLPD
jgi:UDP-GlcNAc:undecaprenyl-phosphate/decaprenyl-phosphate GlcNAc-1-phosphate transferase